MTFQMWLVLKVPVFEPLAEHSSVCSIFVIFVYTKYLSMALYNVKKKRENRENKNIMLALQNKQKVEQKDPWEATQVY